MDAGGLAESTNTATKFGFTNIVFAHPVPRALVGFAWFVDTALDDAGHGYTQTITQPANKGLA